MSSVDDDATLTQLSTAWTGLALGGAKVQEAAYVYQELGDKYTWTVRSLAKLHETNPARTCQYCTSRECVDDDPRKIQTEIHPWSLLQVPLLLCAASCALCGFARNLVFDYVYVLYLLGSVWGQNTSSCFDSCRPNCTMAWQLQI